MNLFAGCKDEKQLLGEYGGYLSTCWENMTGTGEFESTRAKQALDEAFERLQAMRTDGTVASKNTTIENLLRANSKLAATNDMLSGKLEETRNVGILLLALVAMLTVVLCVVLFV